MKSLKESILDTTNSGKEAVIIKDLEEAIPGVKFEKDFIYDKNIGKIGIWDIPKGTTIKMSEWPEHLQFCSFDVYTDNLVIEVNGDEEYAKFLKCFNCSIGEYRARNLGKTSEPKIVFKNCTINTDDLHYTYNGKVVFMKCKVNLMSGLKAPSILLRHSEVQMPYGFDNLKYFDRLG